MMKLSPNTFKGTTYIVKETVIAQENEEPVDMFPTSEYDGDYQEDQNLKMTGIIVCPYLITFYLVKFKMKV